MWRYIFKRFYISIPIFLLLFAAVFVLNKQMDGYIIQRVKSAMNLERSETNLSEIVTGKDKVSITYKGQQFNIALAEENKDNTISYQFSVKDGNNQEIQYTYDPANAYYLVQDERFSGFTFTQLVQDNYMSFYVTIDGRKWIFTNQLGDGTYYLYNRFNKWDKIYNPPTNILAGYEKIASSRGYMWSRSIPLLKEHIFLGSGADTYTMVFPQNDYVGFYNYGYEGFIITKPHSLYLQMSIQTGLISLIAFLTFYAIYFISSLRLYFGSRFTSYYSQVGVAIMIGTFAYMVTGLTNDSSITTAPVFWALIGIGLAVNHKAKPLIQEERKRVKMAKQERKELKKLTSGVSEVNQ